ncbi:cytochrome b5 reductase 4 isoform X2 [Orussus abietinus]|uniref:cytochrome b5 reductase 4 isoform X2 n=1 Tax=Orussus abietinus TaxID=222816 RepID=UPI000626D3DA|nr:cytochrome b5 reductase 4 isoform X2 [Orussus abietinus]
MPRTWSLCCGAPSISVMNDEESARDMGLRVVEGNPRNKTALAPGHSLMDWIRLGSSGVDLTGVGGIPRVVTSAELAKHNKRDDAWIAIRGIVYNVTRYLDFHPGGVDELMKGVGTDGTKLFDNVHAWVNYQSILQKCVVGRMSRISLGNTEKIASGESNDPSSTSSGSLTNKSKQNIGETALQEQTAPQTKMDWMQTTNTITFSFRTSCNQNAVGYKLLRTSDLKFTLKIVVGKDVIVYELELAADVKWPPRWRKNPDITEIEFTFTKQKGELWKTHGAEMQSHEMESNTRQYRDYEVVSNTPLCKVVYLIVLRAKDYVELVPVGRHIEAKMNVMGMEVSRMYTPVPPCLHLEDIPAKYEPDCMCLIVKRYEDGALSPSMTSLQPGQTVTLSNGLGTFAIKMFDHFTTIHMLAAGTGLTAMLGIIQRALCRRTVLFMNLINFNRNEESIFYDKELDRISLERRFKVTHILSQAGSSWTGRYGKVSEELLSDLIGSSTSEACVFTCGPNAFMEVARGLLKNLGWKTSQMFEFDD